MFAAAATLTNLHMLGQKKRWITVIIFLVPLIAAVVLRQFSDKDVSQDYSEALMSVIASIFLPFVAVYWGSGVLTDEVEGKTLVYIWTRPVNRMLFMLAKFITMLGWLLLLVLFSVTVSYIIFFSKLGMEAITSNALYIVWDTRALFLGGMTYAALTFFFAGLLKKPVVAGLVYALIWDSLATVLPGMLKWLSVRFYIYNLATHDTSEDKSWLTTLTENGGELFTEGQAMAILVVASAGLAALGAWLIANKEFASDDPARQQ